MYMAQIAQEAEFNLRVLVDQKLPLGQTAVLGL